MMPEIVKKSLKYISKKKSIVQQKQSKNCFPVFNLIFTISNGWEPIRHGSTKAHFLRSSKKPNSRRDGWVCLTNSERDECSDVDNVVDVDYSGVN